MGIEIIATRGTAAFLNDRGIPAEIVNKVIEGTPNIVDLIKKKEVDFVINTVTGRQAQTDSFSIRRSSLQYKIPYTTTISGAKAAIYAIEQLRTNKIEVKSIQEYHKNVRRVR